MPYDVPLYRGASCPRCGERLVHQGRVRALFLRPPCLRCPACRFTAWREPRRPRTENAAQPRHTVDQRLAPEPVRVIRMPSLLRRALALVIVAGTGALALPWMGLNQDLLAPEVTETNVATPIAAVSKLSYKPPIPELFVMAAISPVTFSIDPIPLPDVRTFPTIPSSKNLPGPTERTGSQTNLDSLTELREGMPPAESPVENRGYKITYVSIQIRDEQQRAGAIQIAKSLCMAGYMVPEIELVAKEKSYPSTGDIRYYYAEQGREADQIATLIGRTDALLKVRRLAGFDNLPRNRIEIWLPAVGSADMQPADRNFSCRPTAPANAQAFH